MRLLDEVESLEGMRVWEPMSWYKDEKIIHGSKRNRIEVSLT